MLGIRNYNPIFYTDKDNLIKNHFKELRSLVGEKIDAVWTVHETPSGKFWADCPVVLVVNGKQLEFCSLKDNEISITWNEINLRNKLDWYGSEEIHLEWQKNAFKSIAPYINEQINGVEVIEMKLESYDLVLHGIGLEFNNNYLSMFNAFDVTGFTYEKLENLSYTKV